MSPRFAATKISRATRISIQRLELDENELELIEHSIVAIEAEARHGM
jgi:hypothetical protein